MGNIKGITVGIGADTKEFEKGIKKIDKEIKSTSRTVGELGKSLELKYNPELFLTAQREAQKAVELTNQKVNVLKNRLQELEKLGHTDTEHYKKMQQELILTEAKAVRLKNALEDINKINLKKAGESLINVGGKLETLGKKLIPISATAGAILAGFAKIGQSAIKTADDIQTLATQTGLSAEQMQKWKYIAMQTDVSQEELNKSLRQTNGALAKLATGNLDTQAKALQKLGISGSEALAGLDKNIDKIFNNLMSIKNPTEQLAIANELFGTKLGQSLIPMLKLGSKGLEELKKEFENVGFISNSNVAKLAEFDNKLNKIKQTFSNLKTEIGVAILPVMQNFAKLIQEEIVPKIRTAVEWFNNLSDRTKNFITISFGVVAAIAPMLIAGGKLITMLGYVAKGIQFLNVSMLKLLANPIVAAVAAVVAILTILYLKNEAFRESINKLFNTLSTALAPVLGIITDLLKVLIDALMPIINLLGDLLTPIIELLNEILEPLLEVLIIPLTMQFKLFSNIITVLANALKPLIKLLTSILVPAFEILGEVIKAVMGFVMGFVNGIIKAVSKVLNWIIDAINWVLKKVNSVKTFFGGNEIKLIEHVDLDINKQKESKEKNKTQNNTATAQANKTINNSTINNTNNNYEYHYSNDNSTKNASFNITVQNYGEKVDVDDLVKQINIKLAESF